MKKIIVTTTINAPTEAIEKFDAHADYELIVIGDRKTPANYFLKRGHYFSPEDQEKMFPRLSDLLGWNCIQRRNIGFLIALQMGADIIVTVDDDNIPTDKWGSNLLIGNKVNVKNYTKSGTIFDPIGATNYPNLWHRGFPIQMVNDRTYHDHSQVTLTPKIQAGFWNGDPDVDAACRMIYKPDCQFDDSCFPFSSSAISPFNSQNTFIARELMPNYFMFTGIGRLDDIWGAYYLQAVTGERPVFSEATVRQDRNVHDLTKDFSLEIIGYEKTKSMVESIQENADNFFRFIPGYSVAAYLEYKKISQLIIDKS